MNSSARNKYQPSNGTEGLLFYEAWCAECWHDREQDCEILAATFRYNVDDPEYPGEWTEDDDGIPSCSAFHHRDDPAPPPPRCTRTLDMFEEAQ